MNIALIGRPNCGKSLLFNVLTHGRQHVGNWPKVTVEKRAGRLTGHDDIYIQRFARNLFACSRFSRWANHDRLFAK